MQSFCMVVCCLTYSMVSEVVKNFHHYLFQNIQVGDQNVRLLTNIKPALLPVLLNNYAGTFKQLDCMYMKRGLQFANAHL